MLNKICNSKQGFIIHLILSFIILTMSIKLLDYEKIVKKNADDSINVEASIKNYFKSLFFDINNAPNQVAQTTTELRESYSNVNSSSAKQSSSNTKKVKKKKKGKNE